MKPEILDRAAGALVASAAGDALGVPYEFASRTTDPQMIGGGLGRLAPGQWSDDTDMACAITRVAVTGADLTSEAALDAIAAGFHEWIDQGPGDVGMQTRAVLRSSDPTAASTRSAARQEHESRGGQSAGNGSLMRTAPVALAYLHDEAGLIEAARAVSGLTHFEADAGDACILWCLAIRHAVLTGELDLRAGLPHVAEHWAGRLDEAERHEPDHFQTSGWVVHTLQGAWSAITRGTDLADGLRRAVCGGGDTDTVAAIAGALLGAVYGASSLPAQWTEPLHCWPGWTAVDLVAHAHTLVGAGAAGSPHLSRRASC